MTKKTLHVHAAWDVEENSWVAICDELPDFHIKATSQNDLLRKIALALRELQLTKTTGGDDPTLH
jgi:hypothetical protein